MYRTSQFWAINEQDFSVKMESEEKEIDLDNSVTLHVDEVNDSNIALPCENILEWDQEWIKSVVKDKTKKKSEKNRHCHICDYKPKNIYNLKEHKRYYHDKIYDHVCKICGSKAINSSSLKMHVKTQHLEQKSSCEECSIEHRNPSSLSHHMRNIHKQ